MMTQSANAATAPSAVSGHRFQLSQEIAELEDMLARTKPESPRVDDQWALTLIQKMLTERRRLLRDLD